MDINIEGNIDYALLESIIQDKMDAAIRKVEKRFDDSDKIKSMTETELKPYRIVENKHGFYLINKKDVGVAIEDVFPMDKLGKDYIGARIHTTKCGLEIIVKKGDVREKKDI